MGPIRVRDEDRPSRVSCLGEPGIEGDFCKSGHRALTFIVNRARHTAAMEHVDPLTTVRADEVGHVLDGPEDRNLRILERCKHAPSIEARHILWCGHQDDAIEADRLQQGRERLAGARWQVNHQDIGVIPIDEREQPADEQSDE